MTRERRTVHFSPMRTISRHTRPIAMATCSAVLLGAAVPAILSAQARRDSIPTFSAGVAAGSLGLGGGSTATGVTTVLSFAPADWITVTASPVLQRLSQTVRTLRPSPVGSRLGPTVVTRVEQESGIGDLPVSVELAHSLALRGTPSLTASFGATLPSGDDTRGLGLGQTVSWLTVGASVDPTSALELSASVGRELATANVNGQRSSFMESSADMGLSERWSASVGYSADIDVPSGTPIYQALSAGLYLQVTPQWILGIDASRGTYAGETMPGLSISFGTTWASFVPSTGAGGRRRGGALSNLGGQRPTPANPRRRPGA